MNKLMVALHLPPQDYHLGLTASKVTWMGLAQRDRWLGFFVRQQAYQQATSYTKKFLPFDMALRSTPNYCFMKVFKQRIFAAVAMTFWMAIALQGWSQGGSASPIGTTGNGQVNLSGQKPSQAPTVKMDGNGHDEHSATLTLPDDGTLQVPWGGSGYLKSKGNQSISASDLMKVNSGIRKNILQNLPMYNVSRGTVTKTELEAQPQEWRNIILAHPELFVVQ
jgi:hypothetical protein